MLSDGTGCCPGGCLCPALRSVWYSDSTGGIYGAPASDVIAGVNAIPIDIVPFRSPPSQVVEAGLCQGSIDGNLIPPLAVYDANGKYVVNLAPIGLASFFFIPGNSITALLGRTVNGVFQTQAAATGQQAEPNQWQGVYLTGVPGALVTASVLAFGTPQNWKNYYLYWFIKGTPIGPVFSGNTNYFTQGALSPPTPATAGTFMGAIMPASIAQPIPGLLDPVVGIHSQIQICGGFCGVLAAMPQFPAETYSVSLFSAKTYPAPTVIDLPAKHLTGYWIYLEPNEFEAARGMFGV
jgi:hypothetical protein